MNFPRLRILFSAVFFFAAVPAFAAGASDFVLRDLGGGNAEIASCRGSDSLLNIPDSIGGKRIVAVGDWAFAGNTNLRAVILPPALHTIGAGAFSNCTALESVAFSVSLKKIGSRAFFGCTRLDRVDLGYQFLLEYVGQEAFALCPALKSENVRVSANARSGKRAFPPNVEPVVVNLPEPAPRPVKRSEPSRPVKSVSVSKFENVDEPPQNFPNANSLKKLVLVIANENYDQMSTVAHAVNDGVSFRNYCMKTLGIPAGNITLRRNATEGRMRQAINYLESEGRRAKRENRDLEIILYYAGHGVPVGHSEKSCLLPVDGSAGDPNSFFELSALCDKLGNSGAKTVIIFIDACFSGSDRNGVGDGRLARLAPARTPAKPERKAFPPNVAVFSAAALNQSAWGMRDQKHGVFTYVLLKKLKETKGEISCGALRDALVREVPRTAWAAREAAQEASAVFGDAFPKDKKLFER